MAPKLREVTSGLPPEVAPRELGTLRAGHGLDFVEDVLGQLNLVGVERLAGAAKAGGVAVPVCVLLAILGDLSLAVGLVFLFVGTGDLALELAIVPGEPARPRGNAGDQAAREQDR